VERTDLLSGSDAIPEALVPLAHNAPVLSRSSSHACRITQANAKWHKGKEKRIDRWSNIKNILYSDRHLLRQKIFAISKEKQFTNGGTHARLISTPRVEIFGACLVQTPVIHSFFNPATYGGEMHLIKDCLHQSSSSAQHQFSFKIVEALICLMWEPDVKS
jgi:hypothetical protein